MLKKTIIIGIFSLAFASMAFAFSDSQYHQNSVAINYLQNLGIVQGYNDGTYKPNNTINRAEFTKIVMETLDPGASSGISCFPDVLNMWYSPYVCEAKTRRIISGYSDGYFRPENEINLAEGLKIVLEAYEFDINYNYPIWYESYFWFAKPKGLLNGINEEIGHMLTRGEMAQLIYNVEMYEDEIEPEPEPDTFTYTPHEESGIYEFTGYSKPDHVYLGSGEKVVLDNGVTMEVVHSISTSTRLVFYYDQTPRLYHPEAYETIRYNDRYLNPFYSRYGIYIYLNDYDETTGKSDLEIFSNPTDMYQRCLEDPYTENSRCLLEIGRYAPVHESYSQFQNGFFKVIYPVEMEEAAEQTMDYLPGCYNSIKDTFGNNQDTDSFSIFFYYPETESENVHAISDSIVVPFYSYRMDQLEFEHPQEACGVGFFPMSHEMTHVLDYGTQNAPNLREGLANYLSRRFDEFSSRIVCEESGYKFYYEESNSYGPFTSYPDDSDEDGYNVGECYFQRLENTFGISAVNDVIEYLGSTRNIESTGEIGYAGNINFFDDVIEPILGQEAAAIAEEMNIDVTCDYSVPFEGYLCAKDVQ
ncbi:S-layer homology domain-containing protein [Patescibacteria group bacterium]|nr:S-layer homology domain-containing protein [Patescibacteria group bacterium]